MAAQALGIKPMAICQHFPNREAPLQAVTDRGLDRLAAFQQAAAPGSPGCSAACRCGMSRRYTRPGRLVHLPGAGPAAEPAQPPGRRRSP